MRNRMETRSEPQLPEEHFSRSRLAIVPELIRVTTLEFSNFWNRRKLELVHDEGVFDDMEMDRPGNRFCCSYRGDRSLRSRRRQRSADRPSMVRIVSHCCTRSADR